MYIAIDLGIPVDDRRIIVISPQHIERSSTQDKHAAILDRQVDPSYRQSTGEVPVRKDSDIPVDFLNFFNDPIGTITHLLRRLTTGTSVLKYIPVGYTLLYLCRGQTFKFTVVPLG